MGGLRAVTTLLRSRAGIGGRGVKTAHTAGEGVEAANTRERTGRHRDCILTRVTSTHGSWVVHADDREGNDGHVAKERSTVVFDNDRLGGLALRDSTHDRDGRRRFAGRDGLGVTKLGEARFPVDNTNTPILMVAVDHARKGFETLDLGVATAELALHREGHTHSRPGLGGVTGKTELPAITIQISGAHTAA